jgi:hypothetical protein
MIKADLDFRFQRLISDQASAFYENRKIIIIREMH